MSSATTPEPSHLPDSDTRAALDKHGITHVIGHSFEYGGYRYTNIKDAVAEAVRHPGKGA